MGWKAVVRWSRGVSHKKQGIPCQDSGGYICFGNIFIGAVSDGAGSARFSEFGSKKAVVVALDFLKSQLKLLKEKKLQRLLDSQEDAQSIFNSTLVEIRNKLDEQAQIIDCNLNDFACTLLLFIATPNWIAAMQIGDGFMVVKTQGKEYELLFKPAKGEFANETTFITSTNAQQEMQVAWKPNYNLDFFCASTDGLERLAIRFSDWKPSEAFFYPLEDYLNKEPNVGKEGGFIQDFLDSPELNARTDDDKALLICLYNKILPDNNDKYLPEINFDLLPQVVINKPNLSPVEKISPYKYIFTGMIILLVLVTYAIFQKLQQPENQVSQLPEIVDYQPIDFKNTEPLTTNESPESAQNLALDAFKYISNSSSELTSEKIRLENVVRIIKLESQKEPTRLIAIALIKDQTEYYIEVEKQEEKVKEKTHWKIVWAGKRDLRPNPLQKQESKY